jgi:uncharacterized protein YndB with AHSA1/START domain
MSHGPVGREIRREIRIDAAPETVFAFLTDAKMMTAWMAETVAIDLRPGGMFRATDRESGRTISGTYLEIEPHSKVVFTWGGVNGVEPGQSTVEFLLEPDGVGTLVRLRHYGLPTEAFDVHDREWELGGLPKLKAISEGRDPGGLCLGPRHR